MSERNYTRRNYLKAIGLGAASLAVSRASSPRFEGGTPSTRTSTPKPRSGDKHDFIALAMPKCSSASKSDWEQTDRSVNLPTPLPKQAAWQDFELGLVYHFDLDVYMSGGSHHERSRREKLNPNLYRPDKLDTDQWLEQEAGAKQ